MRGDTFHPRAAHSAAMRLTPHSGTPEYEQLLPKQQVLGKQHAARRQHCNQESGQFADDVEHDLTIARFAGEQQDADYGSGEDALRVVDELLIPS